MLPKSQRLTRADFSSLPQRASVVHGDFFSCKVSLRTRLPSEIKQKAVLCLPSKFAVVISAKVAKLSVTRHLLKRRAMEAIHKLPVRDGFSCVLYAKSPAGKASYLEISADIKALLERSHVIQ